MPAETALAIQCMVFGGVLQRFPKLKVGKLSRLLEILRLMCVYFLWAVSYWVHHL